MPGLVGGRALMLTPHGEPGADESMLLLDYQRITAAVRQAAGPVMVLGESVEVDVSVRAKLERPRWLRCSCLRHRGRAVHRFGNTTTL